MSQIDDLNSKIQDALEEVERLGSSMSDIDDLRNALGESNVRLRDNSEHLDKLIAATEGFRTAVEYSTRTLSVLAGELGKVDATKLSDQVKSSEAQLQGAIETAATRSAELVGREGRDVRARVDDAKSELFEMLLARQRTETKWTLGVMAMQAVTTVAVIAAMVWVLG